MATREAWSRIAILAARQHHIITVEQLNLAGFSPDAITRAVEAGRLYRVHRGVYSLAHPAVDRKARLLAGCLACGPKAVTSHLVAGELLGLNPPLSGPIDITIPAGSIRNHAGIRIHRSRLADAERTAVDSIPCTSPARTLVDIAAVAPAALDRVIREVSGRGLLDVAAIDAVLGANPGRRGAGRIRSLLHGADVPGMTRSELERRIFRLCRDHGLPLPEMNVKLRAGGRTYEVDCVWRSARLIIECDSRWHDNPVSATEDARRDQALTLAGWRIHRVRWAQVVDDASGAAKLIGHLLGRTGKAG